MVESGQTFANAYAHFPTNYNGTCSFCGCGDNWTNNCAHLVSKALAGAGFSIKDIHPTIKARCSNNLPIKAVDVRNWISQKTACTAHSEPKAGKYAMFFWQDGSVQHVGFINGTNDSTVKDTGAGIRYGAATLEYWYKD